MKKPRKVFGRHRVTRQNTVYLLEVRKGYVAVREMFSRREHTMSLDQIVDYVTGQLPLGLR